MDRREIRYCVERTAFLSSAGIARREVRLKNISKSGAGIILNYEKPPIEKTILLEFGDGDMKYGTVRWTSRNEMGILFTEML